MRQTERKENINSARLLTILISASWRHLKHALERTTK